MGHRNRIWSEVSNLPHMKHSSGPVHFFFFSWTPHCIRSCTAIHRKIFTFKGILHCHTVIIQRSTAPPYVINLYNDLEVYFLVLSRHQKTSSLPSYSWISFKRSRREPIPQPRCHSAVTWTLYATDHSHKPWPPLNLDVTQFWKD